jgi:hypothetical protein
MDQTAKTFASEGADVRKWIGRIIVAVILGEAIWNLIVSLMNNVVVPWLGDVMGQSSGLPTSFTQRPYNYPDLFVSVLEFGVAGLVAAVLNYFFQRPGGRRVKTLRATIAASPVEPVRLIPQAAAPAPPVQAVNAQPATVRPVVPQPMSAQPVTSQPAAPRVAIIPPAISQPVATPPASPAAPSPITPAAPVARPEPVVPPIPTAVTPASLAPVVVAPAAPPVSSSSTKPPQPPPRPAPVKAAPPKPKKPKEIYYNIVGEPMPSDED